MAEILIKNGTIISDGRLIKKDILVKGNRIAAIDKKIERKESFVRIIDAASLFVLPGAIDAHVHFDLPTPAGNSSDDFRTGSIAAIAGGTTTVIDFVTPAKGESLIQALKRRKKVAAHSHIDYGLHMSITGWNKNTAAEIEECVRKHGITSFKVYLAYKDTIGIDDVVLAKIMKTVAKLNAMVTVHCENSDIVAGLQSEFIKRKQVSPVFHALSRPAYAEAEAVSRVLSASKLAGCRVYIVHVSTGESLTFIDKAQKNKQEVYAETCPQYLLLDDSKYSLPDFRAAAYVISPPLRKSADQLSLWKGLKNGTIQVVATDHCPFNLFGQKDMGMFNFTKIPNGAGGVEHRLALLYTYGVLKKKITLGQWIQLCCEQPAKIFGLYPRKGSLTIGADADIVLWNPDIISTISAETHFQNCDTDIYEGMEVKGAPVYVISAGVLAFEKGKIVNEKKLKGNYLFRK
jgi:dihydropyrimidinase